MLRSHMPTTEVNIHPENLENPNLWEDAAFPLASLAEDASLSFFEASFSTAAPGSVSIWASCWKKAPKLIGD